MTEAVERGLRAAALDGDAAAWRALYDSAFDTVARYAAWRGGSMAEDIVQDAWLVAARRLKDFDPARGRFTPWMLGIAANCAQRQKRIVHTATLVTEPAAPEPPETEAVSVALGTLSDEHEVVLRAKYFERLSVAEIAARENTTEKAVESRLSRAREAFRQAYAKVTA